MWSEQKMNDKVQRVKNKLIELGYIDNEWLTKYLEMLEINLDTCRDHKSTQAHHAIPVNSYWTSDEPYNRKEAEKLAKSDKNNFEVHLLYKNHLLIHSYLTLCTDLENVQQRYESQAGLRKRNSRIGATATNQKLNNRTTGKYKTSEIAFVKQYYSAEEAEEILSL